jgi:hypothetical protein
MRGAVARIGAESVCLLFGAGLLARLEKFRRLCTAITANPPRPRASPGAFGFLTFTLCSRSCPQTGRRRPPQRPVLGWLGNRAGQNISD